MAAALEVEDWRKRSIRIHKGILNVTLIEASYKVQARWYMVPERLAKIFPDASPLCFGGCGQIGTHLHIWWTCPKVRRFWMRVHSLIFSVTQVNIKKDANIALLNKPVEDIPKHTQTLIYYMFLSAKIAIASAWKSPAIDIALLKRKLSWIMLNEKIVSVLRDRQAVFDRVWSPWIDYLRIPGE